MRASKDGLSSMIVFCEETRHVDIFFMRPIMVLRCPAATGCNCYKLRHRRGVTTLYGIVVDRAVEPSESLEKLAIVLPQENCVFAGVVALMSIRYAASFLSCLYIIKSRCLALDSLKFMPHIFSNKIKYPRICPRVFYC